MARSAGNAFGHLTGRVRRGRHFQKGLSQVDHRFLVVGDDGRVARNRAAPLPVIRGIRITVATGEGDAGQREVCKVILDNYAAHKHPKVRAWLARHPRVVFHFVPTSCSSLNADEGYFAKLSRRRLRRGVFRSVVDLQTAINRFIAETNDDPKPFVWTADPDKIIAAVKRGHQLLDSIHQPLDQSEFGGALAIF